jgi:predicted nucleotidyltransferase
MYNEAEDKKNVQLNKPMRGDVKKYKVFVKDPSTGNVKKVNFGDPNMEIKRDDPERRKSFRARHHCDTAKDKTTPRYWSCKFWSKRNVSDLLKEVIEPENVDVSSIQMHDTLNPLIWEENQKLKPEIRKVLLKNAKRFIEFTDMEGLKFNDIILTGSLANFNYNENSDLDVHIILDFDQISENKEFVGDFFKLKKQLWADNLPIQVKGFDVEMYLQDSNEPHHSTGVYSLMKDDWVKKPVKKIINVDTADIQLKSADLMNAIDDLASNKNNKNFMSQYKKLKDKIKKYRQTGLDKNGEYSIENLVFKVLRNTGYLEKMIELKNNYLTHELSVDEILNPEL